MTTKTKRPPCLGEAMCDHWRGERLGGLMADSVSGMFDNRCRVTHGDNPEHSRIFTSGVMPEGVCAEGHDVALERWTHEVMARAGCEPVASGGEG